MKITKTIEQVNAEKMTRVRANNGCDKCPNCGETKSHFKKSAKGKRGGIMSFGQSCVHTSFFENKLKYVDRYKCLTCGVEWQSEPYEV